MLRVITSFTQRALPSFPPFAIFSLMHKNTSVNVSSRAGKRESGGTWIQRKCWKIVFVFTEIKSFRMMSTRSIELWPFNLVAISFTWISFGCSWSYYKNKLLRAFKGNVYSNKVVTWLCKEVLQQLLRKLNDAKSFRKQTTLFSGTKYENQ